MKILFNLDYHTTFGEQLVLNILNDNKGTERLPMSTIDGEHWFVNISRTVKTGTHIDYYYSVCIDNEEKRHEWLVEPHRLEFAAVKGTSYIIYDHWIDIPEDAYLYSSAFTDCIAARKREMSTETEFACTIRLKVRAPQLRAHERLAIVGAPEYLGA